MSTKNWIKTNIQRLIALGGIAIGLQSAALGQMGPLDLKVPPVPQNLQVPAGNTAYLKGNAIGTQNYMCLPGPDGPAWKFLGPQATLFVQIPWLKSNGLRQIATHFLSANPNEGGTARPTWQAAADGSAVWGRAIADSTDPQYVAEGAIPWLLVQIVGADSGP